MKSIPFSTVIAGVIAVLVGYTGSAAIIFQAAQSAGAGEAEITSWMFILGIAMGITTIGLSLYHRAPVLTAWSTPGAAVLVTSLTGFTMPEAIGAFMVSAALITIFGVTGWFEKLMDSIPFPIVAALLAGVLGRFGMDVFISMQSAWQLVLPMFLSYLVFRLFTQTYVIPLVFLFAMILSGALGMSNYAAVEVSVAKLVWITPEFSISSALTIAVPLFVVTMASQNIPGVAVIRSSGYQIPISPSISWTGFTTLVLAPFGCFAVNLAAITAAICAGENSHPDKSKRYIASINAISPVSAPGFYICSPGFSRSRLQLCSPLSRKRWYSPSLA
jgi:benzoate membrane transport protein